MKGKIMKKLWQKEDISLLIIDDRNYAVGKYVVTPTEQKDGTMKDVESVQGATYYSCLQDAVRFIAKKIADRKCKDLGDWLSNFELSLRELEKVFEGK